MKYLAFALAFGMVASAQALEIVQWDFNSLPSDTNSATGTLIPVINLTSGSISAIGLSGATSFASGNSNGGSTDPDTTNNDSGLQTTGYPAQGANNKTAGIQALGSTVGYKDIIVKFDQRHSNTSSKYVQVQYTLNGTTWVDAPSGQFNATAGDTWYNTRTVDLSSIAGANNNANFGFRVVSAFGPGGTYEASNGGTYATSGTYRFDMVTISGTAVPEPGSLLILGAATAVFFVRARRAR